MIGNGLSRNLLGALLGALCLLPAGSGVQAEVGSGKKMTGTFGPPAQRTRVTAMAAPDSFMVSLKRKSGACTGDLSGPARAFTSNVVTLSQPDKDSGTTCTIDLIYAPDFSSIEVKESAACLTYHGVACDFQGTFKRKP